MRGCRRFSSDAEYLEPIAEQVFALIWITLS